MKKISLVMLSVACVSLTHGQISTTQLGGQTLNPITTAVPFLLIGPDSKQGAMGDVGAATEPDNNSIHWNGSKLAFCEKKFGVGATVTPWLRRLVPDINLYYLTGYYKLNSKQVFGASLRYFTLGNIEFTNESGINTGSGKPNEFAIDLAFSQKLSKNFSLGVATRYIYSGISRYTFASSSGNAASTFAVDLSMFYKSEKFKLGDKKAVATGGLAFTNVGAKIKYSNDQNFIPMNMRLGGGLKTFIDEYNVFSVYCDLNKLLVPTPPKYLYKKDPITGNATNEIEIGNDGKKLREAGKDPNVDVTTGILQSFNDAPGGFKEEMREINISTGMEYVYNNIFAVRTGYFHEHKTKGGRQFFTVGMGFNFKVITVDASYLIPTILQNPLQNTWRITLGFNFDPASETPDPEKDSVQP